VAVDWRRAPLCCSADEATPATEEPGPAEVYEALQRLLPSFLSRRTTRVRRAGGRAGRVRFSGHHRSALRASHERGLRAASSLESQPQSVDRGPEDDSDFILDLETIQPVQLESPDATPEPESASDSVASTQATSQEAEPASRPASEPAVGLGTTSLLTEYTCEDCVYVATCPIAANAAKGLR